MSEFSRINERDQLSCKPHPNIRSAYDTDVMTSVSSISNANFLSIMSKIMVDRADDQWLAFGQKHGVELGDKRKRADLVAQEPIWPLKLAPTVEPALAIPIVSLKAFATPPGYDQKAQVHDPNLAFTLWSSHVARQLYLQAAVPQGNGKKSHSMSSNIFK